MHVFGEESLTDIQDEKKFVIICDIIDGTDLLERKFSNWCSAIVVLNTFTREIVAAYIASAEKDFYYYIDHERKSCRAALDKPIRAGRSEVLKITNGITSLRNASLCMYTQKADRLRAFLSRFSPDSRFVRWMDEVIKESTNRRREIGTSLAFRMYNMAGNPMMARLAAGKGVDIVCDLMGKQLPHDIIPGVVIAMGAGAVFGAAEKDHIFSLDDIYGMAEKPMTGIKYILASTKELYREARPILYEK